MTGNVVERLSATSASSTTASTIFNDSSKATGSNELLIDPAYAITIATTLALTVGIIQVILSFEKGNSALLNLAGLPLDAALYLPSGLRHIVPLGFIHQWIYNGHCYSCLHFASTRYLWSHFETIHWTTEYHLRRCLSIDMLVVTPALV